MLDVHVQWCLSGLGRRGPRTGAVVVEESKGGEIGRGAVMDVLEVLNLMNSEQD